MIPLALLALISIYIFIERAIVVYRASRYDESFMKRIRDYVHSGDLESAERLCKKTESPYARLILKGINRIGRPMNDVLVAIENTGNLEVAKLSKGLAWLATTAAGGSNDRIPGHRDRYGAVVLLNRISRLGSLHR